MCRCCEASLPRQQTCLSAPFTDRSTSADSHIVALWVRILLSLEEYLIIGEEIRKKAKKKVNFSLQRSVCSLILSPVFFFF